VMTQAKICSWLYMPDVFSMPTTGSQARANKGGFKPEVQQLLV